VVALDVDDPVDLAEDVHLVADGDDRDTP